jgi:hypothetical protein
MEKISTVRIVIYPLILAALAAGMVSDGLVRLSVEVWVANNFGFMAAVFVGPPFLVGLIDYARHGESEEGWLRDVLWIGVLAISFLFDIGVILLTNLKLGLSVLALFVLILLIEKKYRKIT